MGSQNSKFLSQQQLPHQYRPLKQLPEVYQSILNGTRLQKHKIQVNSQAQINYQKDVFIFRRMNADRIISAYFFQKFTPNHMCNLSYQVCFFTEYPEYAMSLNLVIPFQRGFHLLIECLKGFQLLFNKFGPFPIGYEKIFFDNHHQPKVWISSDLGKTRIQNKDKSNTNQQKMIMQIFRIFDQIKDERNTRQTFSNYLKKMQQKDKTLSFRNVMTYMVDEGSRYFITRSKSISLFKQTPFYNPNYQKQKQLKQLRNNSSFIGLGQGQTKNKNNKERQKQKQANLVSLKLKNKNHSRNSHHNQTINKNSFHNDSNLNNVTKSPSVPINCSEKLSEFTRQTFTNNNSNGFGQIIYPQNNPNFDRQRKNRRHNSQEDYKPRQLQQIDLIKQNYCNFNNNTTNATISTSIYQQNMNNFSNIRPYLQNFHAHPCKQLIKNKSTFNFDHINYRNSHNDPPSSSINNNNPNYHFTIKPTQYNKNSNFPVYTHTPNRVYRKSLDQLHKFFIVQHEQQFDNTKRYQMENNTRQFNRQHPQYIYNKQKYLDKIIHTEFQQPFHINNNRLIGNKSFDYDFKTFQDTRPTVSPSFGNKRPSFYQEQKQTQFQRLKNRQKQKQKQKRVNFSDKMVQFPRQSHTNLPKTRHKHSEKRIQSQKQAKQKQKSPITIVRTQQNESHMILNNLQTLKSIINSQYSDMDSQIRFDLQNFIL